MATNKHAVIRYKALDRCFSNFGRRFYIDDLIEACNNAIYDFSGKTDGIKRRQLFEDIKFMESDVGYAIELDKIDDGKKKYYRYTDKNFSIDKQPLSQTEAEQLKDTILMLNRFKGLPQFDWMDEVLTRLEDTFKLKANVDSVVCFEQNPYLRGIEHFTALFNAIINKQVLSIKYKAAFEEANEYILHPYFLKQYNNRWFLFGLSHIDGQDKVMNMAIDRIVSFEPTTVVFIDNKNINFNEYFYDVIGVTVPYKKEPEKITLRIDRKRYNYIASKPFHPSQTELKDLSDEGTIVIRLKLVPNYEFETLLLGFADSVEVIEPQLLREAILSRSRRIIEKNSNCADVLHD
ncbi:MAG TPA: WYL domain-containing protein, partial [Porphyromonadaceae bacterium]|nr:WYL domain-containing protein [Porphyromonadaceae bacterium]